MSGSEPGRFPAADPDPEMTVEIRLAQGAEAQHLRIEQARVIWEVTQWVAQRRSETGSAPRVA